MIWRMRRGSVNLEKMPKLKVTITNEAGLKTGEYTIDCATRPGLDVERYDTLYTINLIRSAAERHDHLGDFPDVPPLSMVSSTFDLMNPMDAIHLNNVNEIWMEIHNLMLGARLNFASARILKQLEDEQPGPTDFDLNVRLDLHLEKMERFHLATYEMARIEDLIVRLVYEYFGGQFIEVDQSQGDWEKRLTWDRMKDALNKRGKPEKNPHPKLEAMSEETYQQLMAIMRSYRSAEVVGLSRYRDKRTHRVTPSVDHPVLTVDVFSGNEASGGSLPFLGQRNEPEYQFLELYRQAKAVYSQLLRVLLRLNEIIHV
jgi:hypothetical protein